MALSVAHNTDARTGMSTIIKRHKISLSNHPNMRNPMVSLMAPSASYNRKCYCHEHAITNKPLKCYISNICKLLYVHMRQLCQYICPMQTHCNQPDHPCFTYISCFPFMQITFEIVLICVSIQNINLLGVFSNSHKNILQL